MVQREVDGPGQQSWEAPPAEGNLRKAQPGTSRSPSAGLGRLAPLHASKAICRFSFEGRQFQNTHWVTIPSVCTPGRWPCCAQSFRALLWPLLYWEHCTRIPRCRHIFKPMLWTWGNNCNVVAFFCQQGRTEVCSDAFHCRCTHSRCRSSKPKRTTQETTDVRSPIRISLTAVHSILKYTVREASSLDKCGFFFKWGVRW